MANTKLYNSSVFSHFWIQQINVDKSTLPARQSLESFCLNQAFIWHGESKILLHLLLLFSSKLSRDIRSFRSFLIWLVILVPFDFFWLVFWIYVFIFERHLSWFYLALGECHSMWIVDFLQLWLLISVASPTKSIKIESYNVSSIHTLEKRVQESSLPFTLSWVW